MELARHRQELEIHGFAIVPELYTKGEVDAMISLIAQAEYKTIKTVVQQRLKKMW